MLVTRLPTTTEGPNTVPLLLSCFCSVGITWGAIPMLVDSYRSALAGFSVKMATAPALPFWPLFFLSLAFAFLLYYAFQWLGTTLNRILGIVAVLTGVLAITAVVSRKAGYSRAEFLVGREIHEGKNVAVLFSDGYGGLVVREVDLPSHTMLPTVFLIARSDSLPVLQVMLLKRNRLR